MVNISQYENKIASVHCLVIGDLMLDKYIVGNVERISPEAPIPVVKEMDRYCMLGGAANVAANIRALGADVVLIGALGNDAESALFMREIEKRHIVFKGIVSSERITTTKSRVTSNGYQFVRFDNEVVDELSIMDENELLAYCEEAITEADIIVISDYKKGVCTARICSQVIKWSKELGKKVIVDPKQLDWIRYSGAYIVKPNLKELHGVSSEGIVEAARKLLVRYNLENVLVSQSQDGMTLINHIGAFDFSAEAKEVSDVSGAGDTALSAVAVFLAAGAELKEAIRIANIAAGIAVGKVGTSTVAFSELRNEPNKIFTLDEVLRNIQLWKKQAKRIVLCFSVKQPPALPVRIKTLIAYSFLRSEAEKLTILCYR